MFDTGDFGRKCLMGIIKSTVGLYIVSERAHVNVDNKFCANKRNQREKQ